MTAAGRKANKGNEKTDMSKSDQEKKMTRKIRLQIVMGKRTHTVFIFNLETNVKIPVSTMFLL